MQNDQWDARIWGKETEFINCLNELQIEEGNPCKLIFGVFKTVLEFQHAASCGVAINALISV